MSNKIGKDVIGKDELTGKWMGNSVTSREKVEDFLNKTSER